MSGKKIDFTEDASYFDTKVEVGIAHTKGKRTSQEDAYATNFFAESIMQMQISKWSWNIALTKTMNKLQQALSREKCISKKNWIVDNEAVTRSRSIAETQGTTACLATYADKALHLSNVGDSLAFLVTLNENGSATCQQLNTLHSIEEEQKIRSEALRVGRSNELYQLRLLRPNGSFGLALARALGDNTYEPSGLIHTPDNTHHTISFDQGKKQFLIIACDGLTENDAVTLADIEEIFKNNKDSSLKNIADLLINKAVSEGAENKHASGDNVTVMIKELKIETKPFYMAVFDGHGGSQASTYCANVLDTILQEEVNKISKITDLSSDNDLSQTKLTAIDKECEAYQFRLIKKINASYLRLPQGVSLTYEYDNVYTKNIQKMLDGSRMPTGYVLTDDLDEARDLSVLIAKYNFFQQIRDTIRDTQQYPETINKFFNIKKLLEDDSAFLDKNRDSFLIIVLNNIRKLLTAHWNQINKPESRVVCERIQHSIYKR